MTTRTSSPDLHAAIADLHNKLVAELRTAARVGKSSSTMSTYHVLLYEQAAETITLLRQQVKLLEDQAAQVHAILSRGKKTT